MIPAADLANLREYLREVAVKRGEFKLSSGQQSDVYVDVRQAALHPLGQRFIQTVLFEAIRVYTEVEQVGGLETGAIPLVCSVVKWWNGFYVRKQAREYGLGNRIEGQFAADARTIIVDDVVTTGESVFDALRVLDEFHTPVDAVIAIVDRAERPVEFGVPYQPIFKLEELV